MTVRDRINQALREYLDRQPAHQASQPVHPGTYLPERIKAEQTIGRTQVAEDLSATLRTWKQEIQRDWAADLLQKPAPRAEIDHYYIGQIDAYNKLAERINFWDIEGVVNLQQLPEIIHPEEMRKGVDRDASQLTNGLLPEDKSYIGTVHPAEDRAQAEQEYRQKQHGSDTPTAREIGYAAAIYDLNQARDEILDAGRAPTVRDIERIAERATDRISISPEDYHMGMYQAITDWGIENKRLALEPDPWRNLIDQEARLNADTPHYGTADGPVEHAQAVMDQAEYRMLESLAPPAHGPHYAAKQFDSQPPIFQRDERKEEQAQQFSIGMGM
jgi:hypothetical protein